MFFGAFFARCVIWITDFLPLEWEFRWKFQRTLYVSCKKKVVAWHEAELKRLGPVYPELQINLIISDSEYPDFYKFFSGIV